MITVIALDMTKAMPVVGRLSILCSMLNAHPCDKTSERNSEDWPSNEMIGWWSRAILAVNWVWCVCACVRFLTSMIFALTSMPLWALIKSRKEKKNNKLNEWRTLTHIAHSEIPFGKKILQDTHYYIKIWFRFFFFFFFEPCAAYNM